MLVKPIISEKAVAEAAKKRYTFRVGLGMNKTQIKNEVEKTFGVRVLGVRTITLKGKTYRSGKKWILRQRGKWKKAVVTIDPAKQIDLFEAASAGK